MDICLKYLNLNNGVAGLNMGTLPDNAYAAVNYTPTGAFAEGHVEGIDNELGAIYGGSLVQSGNVDPVATLVVPDFVGQMFINPVTNEAWTAASLAPGDWIDITPGGSGGAAFQISAGGGGIAQNIGDSRTNPGNNTIDGTSDGQFNAGVEPGLLGAPPYGTDDDYATVGGGQDNYAGGAGSTVVGGRNNRAEAASAIVGGIATRANGESSLALGNAAATYEGDGSAPYIGRAGAAFGRGEVYGENGLAAGLGNAWGQGAGALGTDADAVGDESLAQGTDDVGDPTVAGGDQSFALGDGADANSHHSVAIGQSSIGGEFGTKACTIALAGPDTDLVVVGDDLTTRVQIGDEIILFDLSGGGFDPNVNNTVHRLTVGNIAFGAGNTTITISGINIVPATAGRIVMPDQAPYAFAMGQDARAFDDHAFAFGDTAIAEGLHSFAKGDTAVTQGDFAHAEGNFVNAFGDYTRATGNRSQTRNLGERAHASDQWAGIEWAQERAVHLHQEVPTGSATLPMYTDGAGLAGTEEIATFTNHTYGVTVNVVGLIDQGGAIVTAKWKLEALFKNDGGVLTQIGATLVTLIANELPASFDVTPALAVSGTNIRVNVPNDGLTSDPVRWLARVVMEELGV